MFCNSLPMGSVSIIVRINDMRIISIVYVCMLLCMYVSQTFVSVEELTEQ
jgi:hypothetical protein